MTRILLVWSENCPKADDSYYKDGGVIQDPAKGGWSEVSPTETAYRTWISLKLQRHEYHFIQYMMRDRKRIDYRKEHVCFTIIQYPRALPCMRPSARQAVQIQQNIPKVAPCFLVSFYSP